MSGSPMCSTPSRWWRKIQSPETTGQSNTRFKILPLYFKPREPNRRRCLNVPSKLIRIHSIPASKASARPPLVLLRAVVVAVVCVFKVIKVAAVVVVVAVGTELLIRLMLELPGEAAAAAAAAALLAA